MKNHPLQTPQRELNPHARLDSKHQYSGGSLLGVLGILILLFLVSHPVVKHNVTRGYFDFAAFYGAGKIVGAGLGESLYQYEVPRGVQQRFFGRETPLLFYHAAFESLLFVPLASFPPLTAYSVWASVNLLLLLASYFILRSYLREIQRLGLRVLLVLSSFLPPFVAILQGQDSILLFFLYALAFLSLKRSRDYRAGCLLGLGLFKPQLILPFMVPLAVHKRWASVFGFLTAAAFVGLVSFAVTGKQGIAQWMDLLRFQHENLTSDGKNPAATILPAAMANLRGAFDALLAGRIAPHYVTVVALLASVIVLAWAVRFWGLKSESPTATFDLGFSLNLLATLLVSYHLNFHDLTLVGLPVLFVLHRFEGSDIVLAARRAGIVGALPFLFLVPLFAVGAGRQYFHLLFWVLLALAVFISLEIRRPNNKQPEPARTSGKPGWDLLGRG